MRELILLRHAHAEPATTGQSDLDRPLSPQGLAEAEAVARWLKEQGLVPDRVLCSPARRTRETLEAVLGAIGYVEQRLEELKHEYEAGQKMLSDLEQKKMALEQTMLRISGAIQVLEEMLGADSSMPAGEARAAVPNGPGARAPAAGAGPAGAAAGTAGSHWQRRRTWP